MPAPVRPQAQPSTRRTDVVRAQPRRPWLVFAGVGVGAVALVTTALAWNPIARSNALAEMDACRTTGRHDEALRLAEVFCGDWGANSEHVRSAIRDGRGTIEGQILMARLGRHRDLLSGLLDRPQLTPAQRAQACDALAALWPDDGEGPDLPVGLADWARDPAGDPALADAALRLVLASRRSDAADLFAGIATSTSHDGTRARAAGEALAAFAAREGGTGLAQLLHAITGPHRAALLTSPAITDAIVAQASPAQADRLLGWLADDGLRALALAALGGPKFSLPASDPTARTAFADRLRPYLAPDADPAVVAGALRACQRQRLVEARTSLLRLMPSLATQTPPGWDEPALAALYGLHLCHRATADSIRGGDELIAGLVLALGDAAVRPLAAAALAQVTDSAFESLRAALDPLAEHADEAACRAAITAIVRTTYRRDDIVTAAGGTAAGWKAVVARDRARRERISAIRGYMRDHSDDIRIEAGRTRLNPVRAELGSFRDEVAGWINGSDPPPIGYTFDQLQILAGDINMMLSMVNKAWSGAM